MTYILYPNVYLVKGKKCGCLYDFNQSKLYSLNQALTDLLDKINHGHFEAADATQENKDMLTQLIGLHLIRKADTAICNDIKELAVKDFHCKFAWIEITNKCNLRCIHCYNESCVQADKIMSLEDYKLVLDSLINLGVRKIQIIGGEPFFNQDNLRKMLDYTIGKVDFIEIFTNGTLIRESWFEFLQKNHIHVALSVYSYDHEMHDKVTQCNGAWERTNRTINCLKAYHIPYRVCNVLLKGIELGENHGNPYTLHINRDVVRMSGRANFGLLSDELIEKRLITKDSFRKPITKAFCSKIVSGHNCFSDRLYISADLKIYPCVMERRFDHGSVTKERGIVLNDKILHFNKDFVEGCRDCEYRYCCFDCRPNSLSDDIYAKPWYCTYNPEKGEWMDKKRFIEVLHHTWDRNN